MLQQMQQHHIWVASEATTTTLQQVQQHFELSVGQQPDELTEGVNNNNINNNIKRVASIATHIIRELPSVQHHLEELAGGQQQHLEELAKGQQHPVELT